jgi:hypothetical protein
MKKPMSKSTGKYISVPKGVKVEIEKEESPRKEKMEKMKKMKMMEKAVASGVKSAMKSKKK